MAKAIIPADGYRGDYVEEMPTFRVRQFYTPPKNQGQMVTYSYGYADDAQVIVERCHDASDQSTTFRAYNSDDDEMEPWNVAPGLGAEIGRCYVETDED